MPPTSTWFRVAMLAFLLEAKLEFTPTWLDQRSLRYSTWDAILYWVVSLPLEYWMPVTEDFSGVSSAMAVFNFPYRAVFHQPAAGDSRIWFSVTGERNMVSGNMPLKDIPDSFQPYLQDWMTQMSQSNDGQ